MGEFTLSLEPETQGRGREPAQPFCGKRDLAIVARSELKFSSEKNCRASLTSEVTCHHLQYNLLVFPWVPLELCNR